MSSWNKRTLCLITGASQGIGQEIAVQFSQKMSPDSTIILSSRSEKGLSETASLIAKVQPAIKVQIKCYDMSKPNTEDYKKFLAQFTSVDWDLYLLVHNVGSEGSGKMIVDCDDPQEWNDYLSLNLCSMISLTSAFLKTFKKDDRTVLVNITSLAGIQAIPGLGEYSIGKSSREMYMNVLAAENSALRLLTYSPGPVKTAMIDRCVSKVSDTNSKEMFDKMRREETLVLPQVTIKKLVNLLDKPLPHIARVDFFQDTQ